VTTANRARRPLAVHLAAAGLLAAIVGPGIAPAAAQSARPARIGALTESWGPSNGIVGLRDGLVQLGYKENQDFVIGVRFTQGNLAELPEAARDLVRRGVDVIVTTGGENGARAAQAATPSIPIVFIGGADPVGAGLVRSLARPGGNITGVADLDLELGPKRMEVFRELVPGLKRVLLPYDATDRPFVERLPAYRAAAGRLGIALVERPVRGEDEAQAALARVRKQDGDGIFAPRSLALNLPGRILEAAARHGIAAMFQSPFFVERGGLASYAANERESGRQAARLVDRILKGAKPADLPVEQPTKFELTVNVKTAAALAVSKAALLRADRLIE
jgi:putative ABC transport system substrate-binding protein